jgi:hypothetical protein
LRQQGADRHIRRQAEILRLQFTHEAGGSELVMQAQSGAQ